jgi:hypothetical protein
VTGAPDEVQVNTLTFMKSCKKKFATAKVTLIINDNVYSCSTDRKYIM